MLNLRQFFALNQINYDAELAVVYNVRITKFAVISSMKLFSRKEAPVQSKHEGVPEGTFRCEVCGLVQPDACLCGVTQDGGDGQPQTGKVCGPCALWLGMGAFRFPNGRPISFSEKQREKIGALQKEIESNGGLDSISVKITSLAEDNVALTDDNPGDNFKKSQEFLQTMPNLRQLIRLRFSLLNERVLELSGRLTRGEAVNPREIKKANK